MEIFEARCEYKSTIISSQVLPEGWHDRLGGSGMADAILDRITSNAYRINIKGDKSMRQQNILNK